MSVRHISGLTAIRHFAIVAHRLDIEVTAYVAGLARHNWITVPHIGRDASVGRDFTRRSFDTRRLHSRPESRLLDDTIGRLDRSRRAACDSQGQ